MKKGKVIAALSIGMFGTMIFTILSFYPVNGNFSGYKSQAFGLTRAQRIEKMQKAETARQLEIDQIIAELEQ